MRWQRVEADSGRIDSIAREAEISTVAATLLVQRGLSTVDEVSMFWEPRLRDLQDPFAITGLRGVAERLARAIRDNEKILVFGDYDVDGVTSTTMLVHFLRRFGVTPRFVVPRRLDEGYGLVEAALDRALAVEKPDLLVAVDCGTSSVEQVERLQESGIEVMVVDHHQSKGEPHVDCLLVNPHVLDAEDAPWRNLSAVGLVFKLIHGLTKVLREAGDPIAQEVDLREYLDLVAMGTIADLVPLTGENRVLAFQGMSRLQKTTNHGIQALFLSSGLSSDRPLQPVDISFKLSPRINASGRLGDATLPIRLLLADNMQECLVIAEELDRLNRERQEIERRMFLQAEEMIEAMEEDPPAYVLFESCWHLGVVGVVANRISRKYNRPCLVFAEEGDLVIGSGRSIRGISLMDVLPPCDPWLKSWGGHPMAVGVVLPKEHLEVFRDTLSKTVAELAGQEPEEPILEIAAEVTLRDLNERLLDELSRFHPFGMANPEPVFLLKRVVLQRPPEKFGQDHIRFQVTMPQGNWISGVGWKMSENPPPAGSPVDLAFRFRWNYFNDRRYPQIELEDWKPSEG